MSPRLEPMALAMSLCLAAVRAPALPVGDVRALYDWSDLPLLDAPPLLEVSNTRGPAAGRLTDTAPGRAVLLEEPGPGCIERLSIYRAEGVLKVFVDGATAPSIDVPLTNLYQAYPYSQPDRLATLDTDTPQPFPFLLPLSTLCPAGKNACYIPIPYAASVRVELEHPADRPWYPYTILFRRYPAGAAVASYSAQALRAREADVKAAALAWRHMGRPPMVYTNARTETGALSLSAGATAGVWQASGSGTIVSLRLRAKPWHKAVDRLLVLRAYWDGETQLSVEVPVGDFCASAGAVRQYWVLPVGGGGKDGWYWCYLPMPFAGGARLTLENLSRHSIPWLDYEVVVRPDAPAPRAGRFHARWKRERRIADAGVYEMLNTTGAGKLIGYNLYASGFKVPIANFRKSDRMALYRDGEAEASIAGWALNTYFYQGYYTGPNWDTPLSAVPVMDIAVSGTYADHRYFLNDAPNWETSARLAMEIQMDEETGRDFASTVYWYGGPGGTDRFPPLKRDDLLLPMLSDPGAIEAEDLAATAEFERGDLMVVEDPDQRYGAGHNKYVAFAPMGFGDRLTFHGPAAASGMHEVRARLLWGPSGGAWNFTANDAPVDPGAAAFHCLSEETQIPAAHARGWVPLGKHNLVAGDNRLTFISCSPSLGHPLRGMLLTLDAFMLKPVGAGGSD